jgi:hypothetical protein
MSRIERLAVMSDPVIRFTIEVKQKDVDRMVLIFRAILLLAQVLFWLSTSQ